MPRHLYLFEYVDRPLLDIGELLPEEPPPRPQVFYRCPRGCGATARTPKRCRACGVKMSRVRELVP